MKLHPIHAAIAGAMLLALAAPSLIHAQSSTPNKHPTMLSHQAFAKAEVFINQTARPLERTLFAFYFVHGSFDDKHGIWHALPKEANAAPHASWWRSERIQESAKWKARCFRRRRWGGILAELRGIVAAGI
jgi:hypothetical protein